MCLGWENSLKTKIRKLTLHEITDLYKICKPYISFPFEPYIVADSIYTVSKDKANKIYKLLYGANYKNLDDNVGINMAIAFGFMANSCETFFQLMVNHGNN